MHQMFQRGHPRRSYIVVVIRKQSLGRSPLGTAATHHNDVTTRSSIPIHVQQQISPGLPDNPWLMHYYYLISLLLFLLFLLI
ncbi:hypothetical protein BDV24DRAFT_138106 [Aspergillus arachidicola]|uniref:Uncharacterized protein n=1 Tax=Aspergillus arachidicola TaxID=656916 RepID=A0A5N6XZ67_9EURO|nr:hypothetical protein BDV24DRAFT_138106 [Aspergillus arachidicola]